MMGRFVVRLRDPGAGMWGNETEISADTARDAAEQVAGTFLVQGFGVRADLRARVWPTPVGSKPDIPFYLPAKA